MSDLEEQRTRAREALIGKSVAAGRYTIRGLVGHGGMGAVYEAEHSELGKRVAVKFIDPEFATDESVVARFAREARAMSAVESPHIVTVFDAGKEDGRPYLVMELLRGEDLGQRLRRTRRVPEGEAMHVVAQVLKGLARAHAAGIVHRDLKPDNVFLLKSDHDPLFAKIVDFGVSKIERPREKTSPLALTGRGTVLGTPFYMSPEQAQCSSDVDGRADVYSVGAILFECLTGRPPHTGESYEEVILSICMKDAPNIRAIEPTISPEVAAFVARSLARDKVQRFASAERMLAALHEIAPVEKTRVPLDPPAASTMMSAGRSTPAPGSGSGPGSGSQPLSMQTRLGMGTLADGSGPRIPVASSPPVTPVPALGQAPAAASGAEHDAAISSLHVPGLPKKRKKGKASMTPAIVTAVIATITGIAATAAILTALDKKKATTTTTTHATTTVAPISSVLSPPPPPPSPPAPPSPSSTAAEPSPPPSAVPQRPPPPRTSAKPNPKPAAPATTKNLDINRDLP